MIFRVNGTTVETRYNADNNVWFASAYDKNNCYFKNRRLREGVYPFFNGIIADVDYAGKKLYETNVQPSTDPLAEPEYTGISFFVGAEDSTPNGMDWDGASFWSVGGVSDTIYKYDADGIYTGTSFFCRRRRY